MRANAATVCVCLRGSNKFNKSVWVWVSVTDSLVLMRELWLRQYKQEQPKPELEYYGRPLV